MAQNTVSLGAWLAGLGVLTWIQVAYAFDPTHINDFHLEQSVEVLERLPCPPNAAIFFLSPEAGANVSCSPRLDIRPGVQHWLEVVDGSDGIGNSGARGGVRLHVIQVELPSKHYRWRATTPRAVGFEGARSVTSWSQDTGAFVAINSAFFSGNGVDPLGLQVGEGHAFEPSNGEVRCNNYRRDAFVCNREGDCWFRFGNVSCQMDISDYSLVASSGPVLIEAGAIAVAASDQRAPRTALGLSFDRRRAIMLVAEGRNLNVAGLTLHEVARVLRHYGAYRALNFDGGGSSGLAIDGQRVSRIPGANCSLAPWNLTCDLRWHHGFERKVSNHLGLVAR